MAADSKQNLKQLRVDNWAVFFLQRLQLLFAKGDCCDLTLKFVSGQELKVHRLVLSTSTTFFESMDSTGNVINLPESLPYSVVQPIINFLYSGRLEFKAELHSQLLAIAKIMKLAILARILVAQKKDNGVGEHTAPTGKATEVKKVANKATPKKLQSPSTSVVNIIAGKKLPIWKKRTVPYKVERKPVKEEEPRPTRFEWPDGETCNNMLMASPSFTSLSYESAPVISPPVTPPSLGSQSLPSTSLKRRVMPPISSIPDKIFKADGNNPLNAANDAESKSADGQVPDDTNVSDDDDYDDDGHFETIHTYGDSDDEPDPPVEPETPVSHLKPILKPLSDSPLQTPCKKVRFSLTPEDKENKNDKTTENVETKSSEKTDITNHTKIIQEVLKKYPELVKNNKNIKLKITAPGSGSKQNTITIDAKKAVQTKSSYIVLKPTKTDIVASPASPSDSVEKPSKPPATSENSKGPWKCETCISGNDSLKFENYLEFRKHLQEVHSEKTNSNKCVYCGYKASKRNLHLYHLYTKHGVDPPKHMKFPKCTQCSYIALSESLLTKHLLSHQAAKDLTCQVCNTTFKTHSSLHVHSLSCKANSGTRSYPCPKCKKIFKTNVSLNAHVKVCSVNPEEGDDGEGTETSDNVIEVPIIETVGMNKGEHALVQIPSGLILAESPNVTLLPSSESETLSTVASSIATSIGLTVALPQEHQQAAVILLDGNSQFFLQGNESTMVMSNEREVEEYIVPELLRDEMGQIYTTQNVPYTVTSTGVITCPVMSIQSTNEVVKDKAHLENDSCTTLNLSSEHNYAEGELKNGEGLDERTLLLESAETHLESSNTRVAIKDSQTEDIDVANLEKALLSPEPSDLQEEDDNSLTNHVSEISSNTCQSNNIIPVSEVTDDMIIMDLAEEQNTVIVNVDENIDSNIEESTTNNVEESREVKLEENTEEKVEESIEDRIEQNTEKQVEENVKSVEKLKENNEDPLSVKPQTVADISERDKAISLVRDWGFDNDEESEDEIEDPESKPSRPTMDF